VSAIFEKLGVEDRTQAALLAAKHDVIPPPTTR
jgi:DNA-binding NarL/FixJ family response regulator